jgi:type I restriction enzyme, S subunit
MTAWPQVPLSDVLVAVERAEPVQPLREYKLLGVRLDGLGPFLRETKFGSQVSASTFHRVEAGDFIYSRLFAWRGAFGVVPLELDGCYVSGEFPTFRPVPGRADVEFVRLWFRLGDTLDRVLADCTGSTPLTRNRFKEEFFLRLQIPLPSLPEQRRIVARIEELAGRTSLAQTISAALLLELDSVVAASTNALLSEEQLLRWPAVRLGDATDIRSGVTLGRRLAGPTISLPYLRVANVQAGRLDLAQVKEVEVLASEHDKWQLAEGDVLLTEGGDWDKLGRGTVWHGEIPGCIHQNHIFRVRVDRTLFDPDFISTLLSAPYGKGYFQEASKQTTNLASINQRQLKAFKLYRPPLDEQRRIVAELDALQAKVDELKRLQAETQAELDALLPSILDRAFKGEL